jgi:hypothetical protein
MPMRFSSGSGTSAPTRFGEPLTPTQIDRIRWHLFPEVRLVNRQLSLLPDEGHPRQMPIWN